MIRLAFSCTLLLMLSACSLTPPAAPVALPVPATWPGQDAVPGGVSVAGIGWRQMFPEPRLQGLIDTALQHNRDLRLALLNVAAFRAQHQIASAARLPAPVLAAGSTRQRAPSTGGADTELTTQHGAGLSLSAFEIDLFGRLRAQTDAAFARYLASAHGARAARLALVAAVADAYLAERLATEQLALALRTAQDWRASLELAQRLHAARQHGGLDVAQAEGQLALAEADVAARERAAREAQHALGLLVGADIPAGLPAPAPLDRMPLLTALPPGLPADLLHHRPDLQQAERELAAAHADIGAARAAFFPSLTLTASLGYASPAMSSLFSGPQRVWSVAPHITQPLFQQGRLRAELRIAELRKEAAVAGYERAIQTAFREVADGLAGQATYARQLAAQQQAVDSMARRASLSELRYRAGVDSRLELLDAQRQLYAARQALLDVRRAQWGNVVALYKALGGGSAEAEARDGPLTPPGSTTPTAAPRS